MKLRFAVNGLVPMIIQDTNTGVVLSLFYADDAAIKKMQKTGYVWRYSRSNRKLMKKGMVSGNVQKIVSIAADCDGDALLVCVNPKGPACHTNSYSCFVNNPTSIIPELAAIIKNRKNEPLPTSYTSKIIQNKKKIIAKLREECEELVQAKNKKDIKWEAADLMYFLLVYLENQEVRWTEVLKELTRRRKNSNKG